MAVKNKYGQYPTPEVVADFMLDLADIKPTSSVLEPSCGEGIFLKLLQERKVKDVLGYEIDKELCNDFGNVIYESFVSAEIEKKFDLVIGNPPYIRWKNLEEELKVELATNKLWQRYFNSLCDYSYIFSLKSIELLKEGGQLIFICPEYWMNTTHSISLRNYMVENGYFEKVYHFNETPIFDGVNVSIVIFKYIKGANRKNVEIEICKYYSKKKIDGEALKKITQKSADIEAEFFSIKQFQKNQRWILAQPEVVEDIKLLESNCSIGEIAYQTIGDYCDIGNGLVSGLDKAFQLNGQRLNEVESKNIIKVIKAKGLAPYCHTATSEYIFLNELIDEKKLEKDYPNFYEQLLKYQNELNNRYKYNRDINYWEWVFLRNFNLFKRKEKRIFVPCKERISNKDHFRFSLIEPNIFPTQDVTAIFRKPHTKESIEYIVAYLNTKEVFNWLKYNGIVKGSIVEFSEKPISSIPFRKIDWSNSKEVMLHEKITECCKKYIESQSPSELKNLEELFNKLLHLDN